MKNVYFLSDAHLGSRAIEHGRTQERRLVNFLDSIKHKAAAVYLVRRHVRLLVRVPHGRAQRLHPLSRQAVRTDGYGRGSTLLHQRRHPGAGITLPGSAG